MSLRRKLLAGPALLALALAPQIARAATSIHGDTAAGRTLGTIVTAGGTVYTISGGARVGANLFESFSDFSLAVGDTARWTYASGAGSIANVINRVTGGAPSQIDGAINSTALPKASFFFINPAGIVFGAGARVNVPGAAHFSTASELVFKDGAVFTARTAGGSTLTMSAPMAFGFLGGEKGMSLNGLDSSFLTRSSERLLLAAPTLQIGHSSFTAGRIGLVASGAKAQQISLSGPVAAADGSLVLDHSDLTAVSSPGVNGRITIAAGAIDLTDSQIGTIAGSKAAGSIDIAATSLRLNNSGIFSDAKATLVGADIDIATSGQVVLANDSFIRLKAGQATRAGAIEVRAGGPVAVLGGSVISDDNLNGRGGAVTIKTGRDLTLGGGSHISADTLGTGHAGQVILDAAGKVALVSTNCHPACSLVSDVTADSRSLTGAAGLVSVRAQSLSMTGGAFLSSQAGFYNATSASQGNAGQVKVITSGDISLADGSFLRANGFDGAGGRIRVAAGGNLTLTDKSHINTTTFGAGRGGQVLVAVAGDTVLSQNSFVSADSSFSGLSSGPAAGAAGTVKLSTANLTLSGKSAIGSTSSLNTSSQLGIPPQDGGGSAGDVTIRATGAVSLSNQSSIASQSKTLRGDAGSVSLTAKSLALSGGSNLTSQAGYHKTGVALGDAGRVTVNTSGDISLDTGSFVSANEFDGKGGRIEVADGGNLSLNGKSHINSTTFGSGHGGQVVIAVAGDTILGGKSSVSADSTLNGLSGPVQGAAGTVRIRTVNLSLDDKSTIGSASNRTLGLGKNLPATGGGNAGDVRIHASGAVVLTNQSSISSESKTHRGNAGSVSLAAQSLSLAGGSELSSQATYHSAKTGGSIGNAGRVAIRTAGDISLGGGSFVTANKFAGAGGRIQILSGGNLTLSDKSHINSITFGAGHGGQVEISVAGDTKLDGQSAVKADSSLSGFSAGQPAGAAGTVTIRTVDLTLDHQSAIGSTSNLNSKLGGPPPADGGGNAGAVVIAATGAVSLMNQSAITSESKTHLGDAGSVSLTARSLSLAGASELSSQAGYHSAKTGGSVGRAGLVSLTTTGDISLAGASLVTANKFNGQGGGVQITDGGSLALSGNSHINSATFGSGQGGQVDVVVAGATSIVSGSFISADTIENHFSPASGMGAAGDVILHTASLQISQGFISTDSQHTASFGAFTDDRAGNAGNVMIDVTGAVTLEKKSSIASQSKNHLGDAGSVTLTAGSLSLTDKSFLSSQAGSYNAQSGSVGNAGLVSIRTTGGDISLDGGSFVTANTFAGQGGGIQINGGGNLALSGKSHINSTTFGSGAGGQVVIIVAGDTTLAGKSSVSADTTLNGLSGPTQGAAGTVKLQTVGLTLADRSTIGSASNRTFGLVKAPPAYGGGKAGDVVIQASGAVALSNQSSISSESKTQLGDAGSVRVTAQSLSLTGKSELSSQAGFHNAKTGGSVGAGGLVYVSTSGGVSLANRSLVTANVFNGRGGGIQIVSGGDLSLTGKSHINTITFGSGLGGTVDVTVAGATSITGGAVISADTIENHFSPSSGMGAAGDVNLQTGTLQISRGGISTDSTSVVNFGPFTDDRAGDAGKIVVTASGAISVADFGSITSTAFDQKGDAGSVTIKAASLSLSGGGTLSSAIKNPNGVGVSGKVSVVSDGAVNLTNGGQIRTDSADPLTAGDISVQAASVTLSEGGQITSNASGQAGAITVTIGQGGFLYLNGATTQSFIQTNSGAGQAGVITLSGAQAIILNGGHIQSVGPQGHALVKVDALTVLESSDRSNSIDVTGTLEFNSQLVNIASSVASPNLSFLDSSKVLRGQCAVRAASGETSRLTTRLHGPYAGPARPTASTGSIALAGRPPVTCGPPV